MSVRTITVAALLVSSLVATAVYGEAARREQLRQEYAKARGELSAKYADWLAASGRAAFPPALDRAFGIAADWTAEILNEHPGATAPQLFEMLQQLDPPGDCAGKPCVDDYRLTFATVRLDDAAIAVSASYERSGTFFVIARGGSGRFRVAWHVKDVAKRHTAARDELGRWAWIGFSWGDGPLVGTVHPLPPAGYRPRFYVQATAATMAGGTYGNQIGIWEWNGREAVPELLQSYDASFDTRPLRLDGDVLVVPTKGAYKSLSTCGACAEPEVVRQIALTVDGAREISRAYTVPELAAIDELWDRLIRRQKAESLAAPGVITALRRLAKELSAENPGTDRNRLLGTLGNWNVLSSNGKRKVALSTDNLDCRTLTFTLDDRMYVVDVETTDHCK